MGEQQTLCMNPRCHLMREHSPDECGWPVFREPTPPATPRGSCAFGQHEWKGTNAEGSCICGELTLSRTPPATPQQPVGLVCPFCGDDDFDAVGLKLHLTTYCEAYASVEVGNRVY